MREFNSDSVSPSHGQYATLLDGGRDSGARRSPDGLKVEVLVGLGESFIGSRIIQSPYVDIQITKGHLQRVSDVVSGTCGDEHRRRGIDSL